MKEVRAVSETETTPGIDRLIDLANSRGVGFEAGMDRLARPEGAAALARRFVPDAGTVDSETVAQMVRLREALYALFHDGSDGDPAWADLNAIAGEASFCLRFTPGGPVGLEPQGSDPVVAAVLRDLAGVVADGKWDRLKVCADTACGAAFFDTTRGRTQRWHSYAVCGNKNNVAAHRARHGHADKGS